MSSGPEPSSGLLRGSPFEKYLSGRDDRIAELEAELARLRAATA